MIMAYVCTSYILYIVELNKVLYEYRQEMSRA